MSFDLKSGRLSLAYQYLLQFPYQYINKYGLKIKHLDISHNLITDYRFISDLPNLETLIIDHNNINAHVKFPPSPQLVTLWVNHNRIANIVTFVHTVRNAFPNLKYLSMWNNSAAPSFFNGGTIFQYKDYRYYVISYLPNLVGLDDKSIDLEERKEGFRIYGEYITEYFPSKKNADAHKQTKKKSINSAKSIEKIPEVIDLSTIPDIPVVNNEFENILNFVNDTETSLESQKEVQIEESLPDINRNSDPIPPNKYEDLAQNVDEQTNIEVVDTENLPTLTSLISKDSNSEHIRSTKMNGNCPLVSEKEADSNENKNQNQMKNVFKELTGRRRRITDESDEWDESDDSDDGHITSLTMKNNDIKNNVEFDNSKIPELPSCTYLINKTKLQLS